MDGIRLFVVYANPSDFPGQFVVREQTVVAGQIYKAKFPLAVCDTLAQARAAVPGGYRLERDPADDPVIVESWML